MGAAFLEAGEGRWAIELQPAAKDCASMNSSRIMSNFLRQAAHVGSRPLKRARSSKPVTSDIGVSVHKHSVWMNQRLLSYTCESRSLAHHLICSLAQFRGSGGDVPL